MKRTVLTILIVLGMIFVAGCANYDYAETGNYIMTANDARDAMQEGAILVDVQAEEDYAVSHVEGAVNIPMSALVVNEPYSNLLADTGQIEQVMGSAGIRETDMILVYDNASNMQAARVQWTLNMFSNFNVKVVSGGMEALEKAGAQTATEATKLPETEYKCGERQKTLYASLDYVNLQVDKDEEGTVIIDTRSAEEYAEGTIPGAINIEYTWNNYPSGEYKSPMDLQSTYIGKDILPDMNLIVFCKTSVRAAQTYTALMDAGYKNVRVYDGAWIEYSAKEEVVAPAEETIVPTKQDAS